MSQTTKPKQSPAESRPLARIANHAPCVPALPTLVEALRKAARDDGDALYVNLLDADAVEQRLTYAQVLSGAELWARYLLAQGLERGARALVVLPTGADFLAAFFGIQIAGAIPVPCSFPIATTGAEPYVLGFADVVASADPQFLITVPELAAAAATLMRRVHRPESVVLNRDVREATCHRSFAEPGAGDTALLQYTSGPVRAPTGVVLTHEHVLCNIEAMGRSLEMRPSDIALSWLPLVHDMGLVGGVFMALYWRCPLHVMPPQSFLMHPHLWLQRISHCRASISVSPNAAYQLCVQRVQERHLQGVDLRCWRAALCSAEQVLPETAEAFTQRFAAAGFAARAFIPCYGLSENTLATSMPSLDEPYTTAPNPATAESIVSVGQPLGGQEIAILNRQGEIMREREIGEVVVQGPCVMSGYFRNPEATQRAIADGWLHTGDCGFVDGGRLHITGRKKDMVIKLGRNYYPEDIEQLVESGPHQARAPVVAFARPNPTVGTEDLVLVIEHEPLDAAGARRLRIAINGDLLAGLGIRADHVILISGGVIPDQLDRRERRRWARDRFLRGEMGAVPVGERAQSAGNAAGT